MPKEAYPPGAGSEVILPFLPRVAILELCLRRRRGQPKTPGNQELSSLSPLVVSALSDPNPKQLTMTRQLAHRKNPYGPSPCGRPPQGDKVRGATSHPTCLTVLCCRFCNALLTSTHHKANCINCINSIFLIFCTLGALVSVASLIRKRLPLWGPVNS